MGFGGSCCKGAEGKWEQQQGRAEPGPLGSGAVSVLRGEASSLGGFPLRKWCLPELCVASVPGITLWMRRELWLVFNSTFVKPLRALPIPCRKTAEQGRVSSECSEWTEGSEGPRGL